MAKPELEDGFTQIANEVLEHLIRLHLSSNQWQVLLCIIRKTYGFHKKADFITNSQIVEATGLGKTVVSRALNNLTESQVISRQGKYIGFQKDWERWERLAVRLTTESGAGRAKRITRGDGYIGIWQSEVEKQFQPMVTKQGYILEHRLVMARSVGRCLEDWEVVHHRDGVHANNELDNLELLPSRTEHMPSIRAQQRIKELEEQVAELLTKVDEEPIDDSNTANQKLAESSLTIAKLSTKVSSPRVTQKIKDTIQNIQKERYGEFQNVLLSKDEYEKLKNQFAGRLPGMIEELSSAIESKGYKYKSHYATVLNWERRKGKEFGNGINQKRPQALRDRSTYTPPDQ